MISIIVALTVFALIVATIVLFARERGPAPADIAIAYELAWDRLDFATLWQLSGSELRDGLDKQAYVRAKSTAYAGRTDLGDLARDVSVDTEAVGIAHAVVRTRVVLRDGAIVHNDVALTKRQSAWFVTGYQLAPSPSQAV